ncbi:MAG: hypothetical protein QOE90_920 [Thermoplasmata archaeon]|jgi:hypothetical protein|nr:hypothetical protein [Thermoplasmata archaeon]
MAEGGTYASLGQKPTKGNQLTGLSTYNALTVAGPIQTVTNGGVRTNMYTSGELSALFQGIVTLQMLIDWTAGNNGGGVAYHLYLGFQDVVTGTKTDIASFGVGGAQHPTIAGLGGSSGLLAVLVPITGVNSISGRWKVYIDQDNGDNLGQFSNFTVNVVNPSSLLPT